MEKRINTSLHLVPYSLRILLCIIVSVVCTPPLYTNYITTVAEAFLHLVLLLVYHVYCCFECSPFRI